MTKTCQPSGLIRPLSAITMQERKVIQLKNIRVFETKLVCPRCDGNGLIYRTKITEMKKTLFICDECEATWDDWHKIGSSFKDLTTYIQELGYDYNSIIISELDYYWIHDDELNIREDYYVCPLLNIMIWMGDCYDINAVRNKWVKKSVLSELEKEIKSKIDIDKIDDICNKCAYSI